MADNKGIWCVAETRHGKILPTAFELLTAAKLIAAERGEPVTAVVAGGPGIADAASALADCVEKVIVIEHDALKEFVDEAYAKAIGSVAGKENPRTILLPATVFGRSLAPRLAVDLKGSLSSDALKLELADDKSLKVVRSAYAGSVISTVALKRAPEVLTVRPMAFDKARASGSKGEIVKISADPTGGKSEFVKYNPDTSGEIDLGGAEKIIAGGRGIGSAEGFKLIKDLAHALGAAVGASRATVDAGWIPYKHQVGLTGRAVNPKLYIACGISGQIQHLAGMKSSDVIVAINTDPDCPMMKLANYAVKGDVNKVLPALIEEIKRARNGG